MSLCDVSLSFPKSFLEIFKSLDDNRPARFSLYPRDRFNSLRLSRNGRHFPDDIFKCIFLNKMYRLWLRFHWSLFPRVQLIIFEHLVQTMAWRRPGDDPLFEAMVVGLLTHICVTRPQLFNYILYKILYIIIIIVHVWNHTHSVDN